jgi:cell pole-organizing protein PopZ
MNAVTAPIPNPKSTEARAHEPSMEEILASIRRIIADDQAQPPMPRVPATNLRAVPAVPAAPEPPRRVARPQPEGAEAEFMSRLAATVSNGKANAVRPAPSAVQASPEVEPRKAASSSGSSEGTGVRRRPSAPDVQASVALRTQEVAVVAPVERSEAAAPHSAPTAGAISTTPSDHKLLSPTTDASVASSFNALATMMFIQNSGKIDQAVREMLRPMLQGWLDDNLPVMVERLVRAEIERVARGGQG